MKKEPGRFTLEELCKLAETPRRTVRFYIQRGLVDRPEGTGRGSYYTTEHLERLLAVRRWRDAGLSLEAIAEALGTGDDEGLSGLPVRPRRKGSVEVWSRVLVDDGIELFVDPRRARLSPEGLRKLARGAADLHRRILEEEKEGES